MSFKSIKIIVGTFALALVISYFLIKANTKPFSKTEWHANPSSRYKMATDIIENNRFLGKTKAEIILILGNSDPSTLIDREHLLYPLGTVPSFFKTNRETLIFIIENDKVIDIIHRHE